MAILTKSGRVAVANAVSKRPLHLAWGTGDGAWVTPPAEDTDAVALMAEVGRRTATQWAFVVPDAAGEIDVSTGKFSLSPGNAPTNHLFIETNFDFADAAGVAIRELAVFSDTTLVAGLPSGQRYFAPAEVDDPGIMLYTENITPIFRSPATQENFRVVITF